MAIGRFSEQLIRPQQEKPFSSWSQNKSQRKWPIKLNSLVKKANIFQILYRVASMLNKSHHVIVLPRKDSRFPRKLLLKLQTQRLEMLERRKKNTNEWMTSCDRSNWASQQNRQQHWELTVKKIYSQTNGPALTSSLLLFFFFVFIIFLFRMNFAPSTHKMYVFHHDFYCPSFSLFLSTERNVLWSLLNFLFELKLKLLLCLLILRPIVT